MKKLNKIQMKSLINYKVYSIKHDLVNVTEWILPSIYDENMKINLDGFVYFVQYIWIHQKLIIIPSNKYKSSHVSMMIILNQYEIAQIIWKK